MDDHHPAGFWSARTPEPATTWHPCPSPYGISYRALYSKNIDSLMFAGRDASFSHAAMSSSRVMGTCAVMGLAVGTAAAFATREGIPSRDVNHRIRELQQTLLRDDCCLPWVPQVFGPLTMESRLVTSRGYPEPVRDGLGRQVGDDPHAWVCRPGDRVAYVFPEAWDVHEATLVLDGDLSKGIYYGWKDRHDPPRRLTGTPPSMPKVFHLDGLIDAEWRTVDPVTANN